MKKIVLIGVAVLLLAGCSPYYKHFQGSTVASKEHTEAHTKKEHECYYIHSGNVSIPMCDDYETTVPETWKLIIEKDGDYATIEVSEKMYNAFQKKDKVYFDKEDNIKTNK